MIFARICWALTLLSAGTAEYVLFDTMNRATTAPQQAAGAAMAVAAAVIPYVFSRCVERLARPEVTKVEIANVSDALRSRIAPMNVSAG